MAEGLISMQAQHIPEVAALLARNFLANNPVWSSFNLKYEEIHEFFLDQVKKHLESEERVRKQGFPELCLNMIYIHQGQIIAVGLNLELHEYLKTWKEESDMQILKQFEFLEKESQRMFAETKILNYQPNKHVYGSWITVDEKVPSELKKQFRNQAIVYTYVQFMQQGFKSLIIRASNPISAHIYSKLGAKALAQCQVELKDKKLDLIIMELQFDNPAFQQLINQ